MFDQNIEIEQNGNMKLLCGAVHHDIFGLHGCFSVLLFFSEAKMRRLLARNQILSAPPTILNSLNNLQLAVYYISFTPYTLTNKYLP
jgi:hypothetical protein